ncbi:hypothetical protein QZH41_019178 [Actinostola sp. cb2023]|nr:hypothetical protein QZH41_019178 [Actinostola sp. cb2023]
MCKEWNQFVTEYCGEVMNYRDFQKRAEQYDRQKRRHYYFMTLRADEIIDATFKGSLSRFVNHSCDPNCVTQKWTVNGLLRIGFFTLRKIYAGDELTFDYQLQRYGKVAQTCYCEAPNCRGIIGGEKHTPLKNTVEKIVTLTTSSPRRNKKKIGRSLETDFDMSIEEELELLIGDHHGMTHIDQALKLSRLMVTAETIPQRIMLLKVLQNTMDQTCLKAFIRFQGLLLLWSWMVDAGSKPTGKLQLELLATLKYLPVTTKNQLEDSKVIRIVNKWAYKEMSEQEMPSSCSSQEDNPEDTDRTLTQDDVDASVSERAKKRLGFVRQLSSPGSSSKGGGDDDSAEMDRAKKADKSPDDLSEDDAKSTEDEQSLLSEEDGDLQIRPTLLYVNCMFVLFSIVVSQPDSSGNIEESHKQPETVSFTPPPLMSLEVPIKSQGIPSNIEPIQKDLSIEQDPAHSEWKSISSTSQDPSSSQGQAIATISPEGSEPRHQVFGYKQRMGNGMGDQGFGGPPFNPHWTSPAKSKKFGKKAKWKQQNAHQQFPLTQVGPQGLVSNLNPIGYGTSGNLNNPQGQNWQGPSQQWQKGPQDTNQGTSFYGTSEQLVFQQGQFGQPTCSNMGPSNLPPSNMAPCNIPPPNLSMPPNFPRNIPPPNFPPPSQPVYPRPPPNVSLQSSLPPGSSTMSRFANPQQVMPQQNIFVPNFPPPFQSFNSPGAQQVQFNVAQSNESPSKRLYSQPEGLVKEAIQSSPAELESNVSSGPRQTNLRELASPVKPKRTTTNLPANWKTATDPQGNIYYYHTVTRQTQWEVPKEEGHDMDIETSSDEVMSSRYIPRSRPSIYENVTLFSQEPMYKKKKPRTPKTPPGTPPRSPTLTFTTAAADTTQNRGVVSTSPDLTSLNPNGQKMKDSFRTKLSNVIVNCLNPYYKVDCKHARITNADDFKYLARRLTHGIMNKELQHVKSEEVLQCNDSVKVKTKEYICAYMKKFEAVYKRS